MTEIRSTDYFAIIPEWVLHADISANAVRLYGVLNRFANSSGHAWPSRKTIADLMRVSVATIDRAKEELVEIGALTIKARTTPSGDPSSNLYILHTSPRDETLSPVTLPLLTREDTRLLTRDELNRDRTNERKKRPLSCQRCLGRYRAGHEDGTEGLAHTYDDETGLFTVCPACDGTGSRS